MKYHSPSRARLVILLSPLLSAVLAAGAPADDMNLIFHGTHSRLFSDEENWSKFPTERSGFRISGDNTSSDSPAVVDPGFGVEIHMARIYSGAEAGISPAHVAIADGARLTASVVQVGNPLNSYFEGCLTLRKGSQLAPALTNSGALIIGGTDQPTLGEVVVEPGAAQFSHSILELNQSGKLTFIPGGDSITPFVSLNLSPGRHNRLDGLLQVDLSQVRQPGMYYLVQGSGSESQLHGKLPEWIRSEGGKVSGTGDFSHYHFAILNGGNWKWNLEIQDKDLVLSLAR